MEDTNMTWRKSTYSNGGADACIEVADTPSAVMVRDTMDRGGAVLSLPVSAWSAFLGSLR